MKPYIHLIVSLFLFYAVFEYTNVIFAGIILVGALFPLIDLVFPTKRRYIHTVIPFIIALFISGFYNPARYFVVGWFVHILADSLKDGTHFLYPFYKKKIQFPIEDAEKRLVIWSIVGIILIWFQ